MNRNVPGKLLPLQDRGPLRTLFMLTSMPVGGAETLLMNLCRRFNRDRILPEICCLKEPGPLGETLAHELPLHSGFLTSKWDCRVIGRLRHLMRERRMDAVVTVGAGDKMFWGRLAARLENIPVICSAIHSTGWPDRIGWLNRQLTGITDAFIAVAERHGRYLIDVERFPEDRVCVIPNGIDVTQFRPQPEHRAAVRQELQIPESAPVLTIVAALRPEKNHELFLRAAARIHSQLPEARFLVVGDGPRRGSLEKLASDLGIQKAVHFLGNRPDIADVLAASDVFALTSHNEANPVSILEALACEVPVVATRVGSVPEMVQHGHTGYLVEPGDVEQTAIFCGDLLMHRGLRWRFGTAGRELVCRAGSLESMVGGYERLLSGIYDRKAQGEKPTCSDDATIPPLVTTAVD